MEKEEFVAMLGDFKAEIAKVAAESAEAAVKKYADELAPEVKAGYAGHVQIVQDEAEQPFKNAGEYLMAVKNAAVSPHSIDRRLLPLKATGLNKPSLHRAVSWCSRTCKLASFNGCTALAVCCPDFRR